MRLTLFFLIVLDLAIFASAASLLAEETPARRPGRWEITLMTENPPVTQTMEQCIDAATDSRMQGMMSGASQTLCSKQDNRKEGETFVAESVCRAGGSEITSRSVFKGNFQDSYTGEVSAKYRPPLSGMAESRTIITARHLGECVPGQVPGDVTMPNGMRMNILKMAEGAGTLRQ